MTRLIRWICCTLLAPPAGDIYADWAGEFREFARLTPLHPIARARQEGE